MSRYLSAEPRPTPEVIGAPFSLHTRMPTDTSDFEVGVPVDHPLDEEIPIGDYTLIASELPAGRVATVSYIGPYEGLGPAWGAFMEQVPALGQPDFPFWEVYVTDPSDITPEDLRTDLYTALR